MAMQIMNVMKSPECGLQIWVFHLKRN